MAAGLNHMVARQSKISFSRGSSWPRDRTQVSHIAGRRFNLGSTREAIKYKNTVSQKTSYRDTELQIQLLTSKILRKERKPGWKRRERRQERGGKRGGLTDVSCHLQIPRHYRTFPEKGGLELGPHRNQNQTSSSLPRGGDQSPILSSGWGPFDQIPASRTGGLEKQGRIGRVKERRQRGKGREINKVSCSLPVGALWPVVHVRRRPWKKGSQLQLLDPEWSGCQSWWRRIPPESPTPER